MTNVKNKNRAAAGKRRKRNLLLILKRKVRAQKMASYLHRTAQPSTLATFRSWGSSIGAGRIRLAAANIG